MRPGDLVIDDDMRTLMVVDAYTGLYGQQMADCVLADRTISCEGAIHNWAQPLGYFADELSVITEGKEIR